MSYTRVVFVTLFLIVVVAHTAQAESPSTPQFVMAADLQRTCRHLFVPGTPPPTSQQDYVDMYACWAFIGGMRSMVTAYEQVVLGGPRPVRSGGRVICMPENVTVEQTLAPIAALLQERSGDLQRVQSHAFVFGAWARTFPC